MEHLYPIDSTPNFIQTLGRIKVDKIGITVGNVVAVVASMLRDAVLKAEDGFLQPRVQLAILTVETSSGTETHVITV